MNTEQAALDGMVPDVIPSFRLSELFLSLDNAACTIPWNVYHFYGNKSILAEVMME